MMTDVEKAPLITRNDKVVVEKEQGIEWRHLVLLPIVTLVFCGIGLEFYSTTQWIQHFLKIQTFQGSMNDTAVDACKATNHSDPSYKAYEKVQTQSAQWQLYKTITSCIPAFFLTMILPSYSDSFGRRFLFLTGFTGILLQMILESSVVYFELELGYFVAASGIGGVCGSFYSITSASYSYIADITKGGGVKRTFGFSSFDGYLLACITLSGLGCGYIITYAGYFIPFAASTIMLFVAILLTIFFLPETHVKKNRAKTVNIFKTLNRTIDFYRSSAFRGRRMAYILLLLAFFFEEITTTHRSSIEMLFQLGMPLCWTADKVGIFTALRHAAQALAGLVLTAPLKACFSELTIAIWSSLFNAGSFVIEGVAQTDLIMYLVSVPAILSFLTVPMIKSIMSMMTSADKQGSLFASVSAVQSICGIVATFVMNSTYAATVSIMNGFVFFVLAAICIIVFLLLCVFGLTQKSAYHSSIQEKQIKIPE